MANPTAQQCHAMTTYYISAYREVVGKEPVVNRNKAKAGWSGLLMDYTPTQARELVDYYLDHYSEPRIDWFLYNYEKVDVAKQEYEEESIAAVKRRQETARRLEEWRNRWQK